jgi:hypothetical protein
LVGSQSSRHANVVLSLPSGNSRNLKLNPISLVQKLGDFFDRGQTKV